MNKNKVPKYIIYYIKESPNVKRFDKWVTHGK